MTPSKAQDGSEKVSGEWAILGGLRFLLASIVVMAHVGDFFGRQKTWFNGQSILTLGDDSGRGAAVYAFLMISGFSIAASLERKTEGFLRRRFWRIYPAYAVSMVIALLPFALFNNDIRLNSHVHMVAPSLMLFGTNFLFLQGLIVQHFSTNEPTWSLAIEVWLYAMASWLRKLTTPTLLVLTLISAYFLCNWLDFKWAWAGTQMYGGGLLLVACLWLGGFVFYRHRKSSQARAALIVAAALIPLHGMMRPSFALLLTAALLCFSSEIQISARLAKWWDYLGELSYPMYLTHVATLVMVVVLAPRLNPALSIIPVLAVSGILYHGVDKPLRKLGRANKPREGVENASVPLQEEQLPVALPSGS